MATDLASRLDVGDVVRDLSDHARVLFGADRVAVVLRDAEGRISSPGGTGFSDEFLAVARDLEEQRAASRDIPPRRPVCSSARRARSANPIRAAAVQEGVDTLLIAPLVDGHELHGVLTWPTTRPPLARGRPRRRGGPGGDAAIAVRSARTFGRMAAWANQLQSIQRLGARLSGLTDVARSATRSRPSSASSSTTRTPASTASGTRASCRRDGGLGRRSTATRTPTA